MNLSDSPDGPAWPSRASGWLTPPPPGVSRVACDLRVQTCRRLYPGGTAGGIGSLPGRCDNGLPRKWAGSAPTTSGFEASMAFTVVTACLLAKPPSSGPLHQRLRRVRYLPRRSDCYRPERKLPGGTCTHGRSPPFAAHPFEPFGKGPGVASPGHRSLRRRARRVAPLSVRRRANSSVNKRPSFGKGEFLQPAAKSDNS